MRNQFALYLHFIYLSIKALINQKWVSITAIASISLVVIVLMGFLSMAKGFEQALKSTGSNQIAILLSGEAETEITSNISREQIELLGQVDGVMRANNDKPIYSPELTVIVSGDLIADTKKININLRGIDATNVFVHQGFSLVDGRMFTPGSAEIIVGHKIASKVQGLSIGSRIRLGDLDWKVVGTFKIEGSLFESEIWSSIQTVQSNYNRQNQYQSIRVPLQNSDALIDLAVSIASEPRFDLSVQSEHDYFAKQSSGMVNLITYIGWPLAIILSFGAFAGILNSMRISVESRRQNIIVLRQLGFKNSLIFSSLMFETLLFAFLGAVLGILVSFVLFDGFLASAFSASFNTISYALQVDFQSAANGLMLATGIGLLAGILPAIDSIRVEMRR